MPKQSRPQKSETSKMLDMIIALTGLLVLAYYYYGPRAVLLAVVGIIAAMATDIVCEYIRSRRFRPQLSALVTGYTLALLMPATIELSILIFACVAGIAIGKHVFGGSRNYIFNPAAVGYALAMLGWGNQVLLYPAPGQPIPLNGVYEGTLGRALGYSLNLGALPTLSDIDLWMGRFAGPMGATHIILLAVSALFLLLQKTLPAIPFLSAFGTAVLLSILFPRVGANGLQSVIYEFAGGIFFFGLIFLASDSTTTPKSKTGCLWQGILLAVFAFGYRHFGIIENSFVFALLIVNAMCDTFDRRFFRFIHIIRQKLSELEQSYEARNTLKSKDKGEKAEASSKEEVAYE